MASDMTAEELRIVKLVEDYLKREYFLVRGQAVALAVALLVAFGLLTAAQ